MPLKANRTSANQTGANRPHRQLSLALIAASVSLSASGVPAVAQVSLVETLPEISDPDGGIAWGQSGSIPTGVWDVMLSQTNDSLDIYSDVFRGGSLPQIAEQIFANSSAPGSIPPEVWSVMQSQAGLLGGNGNYSDLFSGTGIFGDLAQIAIGENGSSYDFSSIINRENWGISAFSNQPFVPGTVGINPSETGFPWLSGIGQIAQQAGNTLSGLNPFRRSIEWMQKTPIARTMGALGKRIRGVLTGSNFGFFTRNRIVKSRDQANLFDQEIARMMAEQYLGESGEQWLAGEAKDTISVLQSGLQSANAAMQLAATAEGLTSTQDVAKAVAQQGGQNAALGAALLQMQAQNQASLLQLQQLTSSSIQLAANNSEGIDEANRRERAERSNALRQSASEFIYVPDVFD